MIASVPMLRQVRLVPYAGFRLGQMPDGWPPEIPEYYIREEPVGPLSGWNLGRQHPPPPGICCQAMKDGGVICSDGTGFGPTWPKAPLPNVPGVAEYVQQGSMLVPRPPSASACPSGAAAAPGAAPAPAGAFPIVPVVVGGLAVAGLVAYLALR